MKSRSLIAAYAASMSCFCSRRSSLTDVRLNGRETPLRLEIDVIFQQFTRFSRKLYLEELNADSNPSAGPLIIVPDHVLMAPYSSEALPKIFR